MFSCCGCGCACCCGGCAGGVASFLAGGVFGAALGAAFGAGWSLAGGCCAVAGSAINAAAATSPAMTRPRGDTSAYKRRLFIAENLSWIVWLDRDLAAENRGLRRVSRCQMGRQRDRAP